MKLFRNHFCDESNFAIASLFRCGLDALRPQRKGGRAIRERNRNRESSTVRHSASNGPGHNVALAQKRGRIGGARLGVDFARRAALLYLTITKQNDAIRDGQRLTLV